MIKTREDAIRVMDTLDRQLSDWERGINYWTLMVIVFSVVLLTAITGGFMWLVWRILNA